MMTCLKWLKCTKRRKRSCCGATPLLNLVPSRSAQVPKSLLFMMIMSSRYRKWISCTQNCKRNIKASTLRNSYEHGHISFKWANTAARIARQTSPSSKEKTNPREVTPPPHQLLQAKLSHQSITLHQERE